MSGENQSTQRKICPNATCPPQIPHKIACDKTQVSAARNQQLTTSAMAQPEYFLENVFVKTQNQIKNNSKTTDRHAHSPEKQR